MKDVSEITPKNPALTPEEIRQRSQGHVWRRKIEKIPLNSVTAFVQKENGRMDERKTGIDGTGSPMPPPPTPPPSPSPLHY